MTGRPHAGAARVERAGSVRGFAAILTIIIVFSAIKNDIAFTQDSEYWFSVTNSAYITWLRQHSIYGLIVGMLLIGLYISVNRLGSHQFGLVSVLICSYMAIAILISTFVDGFIAIKIIFSFAVYLSVSLLTASAVGQVGHEAVLRQFILAFVGAGAIISGLNALEMILGQGFGQDNPRFFGTASHPNILGMQFTIFAFCTLSVIADRHFANWRRAAAVILLCLMLVILKQTGSRTAFVFLASAVFFSLWLRARLPWLLAFALIAAAAVVAVSFISLLDFSGFGEMFDRADTTDTRSQAWGMLYDLICNSPWVGNVVVITATENSFLRAWALYGVLYFVLFTAAVVAIVMKTMGGCVYRSVPSLTCAGLMGGLFCSSMLEGYLADAVSVPVLTFFVIAATSQYSHRTNAIHAGAVSRSRNVTRPRLSAPLAGLSK
jgi:hypothetical protein